MIVEQNQGRVSAVIDALRACAVLEMRVCYFYERLAEMFEDDPDVSEFWLHLSVEESEHAEVLRSVAEMVQVFPLKLQPPRHPFIEQGALDELVGKIRACEALMTEREGSLDAALSCALVLETSEMNDIYNWLIGRIPPDWTKGLLVNEGDPGGHILALCQFIIGRTKNQRLLNRARALRDRWVEYTAE